MGRVGYITDIGRGSGNTTASMRKQVRELVKQANRVIYESGYDNNASYFLGREFHQTKSGGITSNIRTERLTKTQAKLLYNQLASFINADESSTDYKKWEKQTRTKAMKRMRSTMRKMYGLNYSDSDMRELFALKESFPELFETDSAFYLKMLDMSRSSRKAQKQSILDSFLQAKKELMQSGQPWTTEDLKRLAMEKAQFTPKESYTP